MFHLCSFSIPLQCFIDLLELLWEIKRDYHGPLRPQEGILVSLSHGIYWWTDQA